jgi:hypothetical protein
MRAFLLPLRYQSELELQLRSESASEDRPETAGSKPAMQEPLKQQPAFSTTCKHFDQT